MKDPLIGFEKDSKMESTEMLCDLWCLRVSKRLRRNYFSGEKLVGFRNQLLTPPPAVSDPPAAFSESVRT